MASLRDLITGRNRDQEDDVRKKSDAFRATQDPNGDAPEEEGAHEDSWAPDPIEMHANAEAADTFGPGSKPLTGTLMPPEGAAGDVDTNKSPLISQLLAKGVKKPMLDEAAENMRMRGSHTFMNGSKPLATVGKDSALGQELLNMGRDNAAAAQDAAPSIQYGDDGVSGTSMQQPSTRQGRGPSGPDAQRYMDQYGIDIRNKTANQVLEEIRKKQAMGKTNGG